MHRYLTTLRITANWDRWSEILTVKLPINVSGSKIFENILSIWVLQRLVILVGCKIKRINGLEARQSKNSLLRG